MVNFLIGYIIRSILWYYDNLYYYWRKRIVDYPSGREKTFVSKVIDKMIKDRFNNMIERHLGIKPLEEPCKSAIKEERCLGCNKLENPDFTGDKECIYCNEKENSINKS